MLTYWTAPVISKTDETIRGIINTMMTQALGHHWHRQQQSLHQNHCKHLRAFLQPRDPTDTLLMNASQRTPADDEHNGGNDN